MDTKTIDQLLDRFETTGVVVVGGADHHPVDPAHPTRPQRRQHSPRAGGKPYVPKNKRSKPLGEGRKKKK